jgi:hypothetical protein
MFSSQNNSYKIDESLTGSSPHIKSVDLEFVKEPKQDETKPSLGTSPGKPDYEEFSKLLKKAPLVLTEYI